MCKTRGPGWRGSLEDPGRERPARFILKKCTYHILPLKAESEKSTLPCYRLAQQTGWGISPPTPNKTVVGAWISVEARDPIIKPAHIWTILKLLFQQDFQGWAL